VLDVSLGRVDLPGLGVAEQPLARGTASLRSLGLDAPTALRALAAFLLSREQVHELADAVAGRVERDLLAAGH